MCTECKHLGWGGATTQQQSLFAARVVPVQWHVLGQDCWLLQGCCSAKRFVHCGCVWLPVSFFWVVNVEYPNELPLVFGFFENLLRLRPTISKSVAITEFMRAVLPSQWVKFVASAFIFSRKVFHLCPILWFFYILLTKRSFHSIH